MKYEFLKANKNNQFYPLDETVIKQAENDLGITFPKELREFYMELGYGFLKGDSGNINRLMDPLSVRDFRLKQNDFEYFPDIDLYDDLVDEYVFFEVNETVLFTIKRLDDGNPIFYDEILIANSLEEFLIQFSKDDSYYMEFVD
ncbi:MULTISPECIES: SMI1/KNR4 family protein [Bacillaceae]|uniref:Knr4/Smi1-like domain-containing protein n=1 Tax=Alkalicoccobacillus plakortidis TaxID=444060 RepID=A0A9D5I2D1_9BACI|nr:MULTISPECIES: SMI1/KNR4 family protein [Bacillaceae]KQL58581.1 hypothetical protein AN965_03185 [Alkalicoccobacillus plakortidis]